MGHAIEAIDPDLKNEDAWHAMVSRAFDINETTGLFGDKALPMHVRSHLPYHCIVAVPENLSVTS
jgi:hypothetical protein